MKNKSLLGLLLIIPTLFFASCKNNSTSSTTQEQNNEVIRTTFFFNYSANTLHVNDSFQLFPKTYKSVEGLNWISSNENIATVDSEGNVTALAVGEAVISAYDSISIGKCNISVVEYDKTFYVELSVDSFVLNVGDSYGVIPSLKTNDMEYDANFTVTLFAESSPNVASFVKNGDRFVFTALNSGTCVYSFVTTYENDAYGANVYITVN